MRTTVAIEDALLKLAKRRARDRGVTLGQYLEEAIRRDLARVEDDRPRPTVPVFKGGTGVRPGVDLESNRALYEFLDEGLPFEKLR